MKEPQYRRAVRSIPTVALMAMLSLVAAPLPAQDAVLDALLEPTPESGEPSTSEQTSPDENAGSDSEPGPSGSEEGEGEGEGGAAPADRAADKPGPESEGEQEQEEAEPGRASSDASDSIDGVTCEGDGPCIVDATGLALRALARSFSPLLDAPSADARPISNAVSAFKPLHVFGARGIDRSDVTDIRGWYQIGFSPRRAMGWMRANDLVEWRQALLLEYLHPGSGEDRRSPVVMFETRDALREVVLDPARSQRADGILSAIDKGERPDGVVGREGREFLNIDETFYLLPIVDWEQEPALDEPSHYLEVFAAVPGARAETPGEGTLEDENFLAESLSAATAEGVVDLVFVIDMTGSMQPYIDSVKTMMKTLVSGLANETGELDAVRFGMIGFRDGTDVTPELEWNVRDFTGEGLVDAETFTRLLDEEVSAATVSSDEWAEDVHGGFEAGIEASWRKLDDDKRSVRILVLVGDASGHDSSSAKNSTGASAADLNTRARGLGIYPYAIHLQDERAEPEWERAQAQFRAFGSDGQGDEAGTISVPTADAATNLDSTGRYLAETLARNVLDREGAREFVRDGTGDNAPAMDTDEGRRMIEIARGVMQAALVDFLGDEAEPPRDFVSWVHDYDLADAGREALGVRVLISRRQLDNVLGQTEALLDAMSANTVGNMDFLLALQQTAAKTALGRDLDAEASLESQEFLPRWIAALPYQSRILQMSPAEFANLKMNARRELESTTSSKVVTYRKLLATPDRWLQLDPSDDTLDEVMALPLTLLP